MFVAMSILRISIYTVGVSANDCVLFVAPLVVIEQQCEEVKIIFWRDLYWDSGAD